MDLELAESFIHSTQSIIKQMAEMDISEDGKPYEGTGDFTSQGITSIITFAGKIKGRFIIDFSPNFALQMIEAMTEEKSSSLKDKMLLAGISEVNNIIAGDAITFLNNKYTLGLRLAPPIVFTGRNATVATSKMDSVVVPMTSEYGTIKLDISFQGGVD